MSDAVQIIPIDGPNRRNEFHVWTKRMGGGPIKMLMLHGGPGCSHEYFESFEEFLPQHGVEFIYYNQLGSYLSDQPDDVSLWTVPRFLEEVERCVGRSDWKVSTCTAIRGVGCWASSTASSTDST